MGFTHRQGLRFPEAGGRQARQGLAGLPVDNRSQRDADLVHCNRAMGGLRAMNTASQVQTGTGTLPERRVTFKLLQNGHRQQA